MMKQLLIKIANKKLLLGGIKYVQHEVDYFSVMKAKVRFKLTFGYLSSAHFMDLSRSVPCKDDSLTSTIYKAHLSAQNEVLTFRV